MTEENAKYRNPRWIDKENRSLFCEILVGQSYRPAQINVGNIEEGLVNEPTKSMPKFCISPTDQLVSGVVKQFIP